MFPQRTDRTLSERQLQWRSTLKLVLVEPHFHAKSRHFRDAKPKIHSDSQVLEMHPAVRQAQLIF